LGKSLKSVEAKTPAVFTKKREHVLRSLQQNIKIKKTKVNSVLKISALNTMVRESVTKIITINNAKGRKKGAYSSTACCFKQQKRDGVKSVKSKNTSYIYVQKGRPEASQHKNATKSG
jgi:hypothetical protein